MGRHQVYYLLVRELTSSCQPERRCYRGQLKCRKRVDPASEAALLPPNREKFLVLVLDLSNSACLCRDSDSEWRVVNEITITHRHPNKVLPAGPWRYDISRLDRRTMDHLWYKAGPSLPAPTSIVVIKVKALVPCCSVVDFGLWTWQRWCKPISSGPFWLDSCWSVSYGSIRME